MQPQPESFSTPTSGQHVLLVTHEYLPFRGGVATYVKELANAASHGGLSVAVWTVDYTGRFGEEAVDGKSNVDDSSTGMPVVRLKSSGRLTPSGLFSFTWGLWRRRSQWREHPVVLLSVGAQMAFFLLSLVGCRPTARVTCFFHGSEVLRFQHNRFWRWLARRFYRRETDVFGVTTQYVADLLRGSGLLPAARQIVLAPCALPAAFHVEQKARDSRTGEVKGDAQGPTFRVLTVARIHPRKGQREVARALALLPEEQRDRVVYQMVGVGGETYRQQVEAACRDGAVRCEFLGALDEQTLGEVYAGATLYAQASRTLAQSVEGFGITFLEASAHGCPVVAWRSGGVAEAVRDGDTGLLVDEGDVTGLGKAVARLLGSIALRRSLGENGKRFARSLRWERAAEVLCGGESK